MDKETRKIVVVSDTHGRPGGMLYAIGQELPFDALVHCGDSEEDLAKRLGKGREYALYTVRGNCDRAAAGPETCMFTVLGVPFYVAHGHTFGVKYSLGRLKEAARAADAKVCLFGHTHIPHWSEEDGILLLNPGSASIPGDPAKGRTYLVLEVREDGKVLVSQKTIPARIPS